MAGALQVTAHALLNRTYFAPLLSHRCTRHSDLMSMGVCSAQLDDDLRATFILNLFDCLVGCDAALRSAERRFNCADA
jgi:hypothetical protein